MNQSPKIQAELLASSVPKRISVLIEQFGLKSLSERTGISAVQIGRYGKGTSQPTSEKVIALALATGASVEWLLIGKNDDNQSVTSDQSEEYQVSGRDDDANAIKKIVIELEQALLEAKRSLTFEQKGETIAAFFDMYRINKNSLEDVVLRQLLKTYVSTSGR